MMHRRTTAPWFPHLHNSRPVPQQYHRPDSTPRKCRIQLHGELMARFLECMHRLSHSRCSCAMSAVVKIQDKKHARCRSYRSRYSQILGRSLDLCIAKLEDHRNQRTDGQCTPPSKETGFDQNSGNNGTDKPCNLVDGVVSPSRVIRVIANIRAS
jgi:hypothetical protein